MTRHQIRAVVVALSLVVGSSASAQIMWLGKDGSLQGSWEAITACAKQAIPRSPREGEEGYNNIMSRNWQNYSAQQREISMCRWILAARDAGWREGGATRPNPFPPVAGIMPDDFKELAK